MGLLCHLQAFMDVNLPFELHKHKLAEAFIDLELSQQLLVVDAIAEL